MGNAAAPSFEIDFEGAPDSKGSGTDEKVYKDFSLVLQDSKTQLQIIEDYKGCRELARKAMSTPTKENELAAFEGLLQCVDGIASFFHYTDQIHGILPNVLVTLASKPLDAQQPLATQLAHLLDFVLIFDQTRMMRPNLSNDFAYYRRLLPKFSKHPAVKVKDDEASGMALFTAEHIPMMTSLTKSAQEVPAEHHVAVQRMLASLATSCLRMIRAKKFRNPRTNLLCARAMTAAIVLYDRIAPVSVFAKRSGVPVRDCVLVLKHEFPKEAVGSLLNAIQYSTKTFKDVAPTNVQVLFD